MLLIKRLTANRSEDDDYGMLINRRHLKRLSNNPKSIKQTPSYSKFIEVFGGVKGSTIFWHVL